VANQPSIVDSDAEPRREGEPGDTPVQFRDIAPAIEFACWVVVALAPFLRWVNGAAVTDDQFVIQVALTSCALAGALGLRFYNYRVQRRTWIERADQSLLE
jgi:hypothetical protein